MMEPDANVHPDDCECDHCVAWLTLSRCSCSHKTAEGMAPATIDPDQQHECYNEECMACACVLCPQKCELHTHHDGCAECDC